MSYLKCFHQVSVFPYITSPQWGAADAEIEVPSGENTELAGSSL